MTSHTNDPKHGGQDDVPALQISGLDVAFAADFHLQQRPRGVLARLSRHRLGRSQRQRERRFER